MIFKAETLQNVETKTSSEMLRPACSRLTLRFKTWKFVRYSKMLLVKNGQLYFQVRILWKFLCFLTLFSFPFPKGMTKQEQVNIQNLYFIDTTFNVSRLRSAAFNTKTGSLRPKLTKMGLGTSLKTKTLPLIETVSKQMQFMQKCSYW